MARLTNVDFLLRQWNVCPHQSKITPPVGKDELVKTAYDIPEKVVKKGQCSIEYSLVSLAKDIRRVADDKEALRELMESQRYGNIFREEQFQEGRRWLFDPLQEIAKAAETNGIYRSLRVDADLLLPTFQVDNVEEFTGFVHKFKSYLSSELDKEHGAMCLQSVYELTVCSRTAFNADGAPLMVSATAEKVSTGGYSDSNKRWSMKNDWSCPEVADMAKLRVKELFGKLKSNEYETVVKLFDELCLYVFSKSTGISMSNLECRVALRRHEIEAATLEAPTNDELEEEEEDDDDSLASVVDATENGGRTNGNTSDAEEMIIRLTY